jgi:hypothetical protein
MRPLIIGGSDAGVEAGLTALRCGSRFTVWMMAGLLRDPPACTR